MSNQTKHLFIAIVSMLLIFFSLNAISTNFKIWFKVIFFKKKKKFYDMLNKLI